MYFESIGDYHLLFWAIVFITSTSSRAASWRIALEIKIFKTRVQSFSFFTMLILVKGRRWQWVPNCPISRIVAFVEKVCNLWPNRRMGRWHRHRGGGGGQLLFSNRLQQAISNITLVVHQEQCKEGICWKNQAHSHSFEPRPKSGQWKSALKGWKGTGRKTGCYRPLGVGHYGRSMLGYHHHQVDRWMHAIG